ncbi:MAG: response regulator, partial [Syntrophorhabdaceae bacterium]|nr:response regulator [Syntrophorhabdaceae bacterium]
MKRKVLVVDDEENIRLLFKEELEEEGYEVDTASNGLEALEKVK